MTHANPIHGIAAATALVAALVLALVLNADSARAGDTHRISASAASADDPSPRTRVAPGVYLDSLSADGDAARGGKRVVPEQIRRAAPRIVGGEETTISEWPWQVAITASPDVFVGSGFDRQICGGTLVTPRIVVTAAHCFFDTLESVVDGFDDSDFDAPGWFAAISGRTQLSSSAGQETDVDALFFYVDGSGIPLYNPSSSEWDVVFFRLASSSSSQTIKIAGPDEGALWEAGRAAYVTGWGLTAEGGSSSDVLRQAEVEMIADSTCGSSSSYGIGFLPETMVCAGLLEGGRDACQGDSGGPLVVPTAAGGFRLVGDTSFGNGCARPNFPGVYGRLADDPIRTSLANGIQDIAGADILGSGAQPPDTDPPETTITSGPSGTTNDASPSFGFSSSEPGSSFQCSLDSAAYASCSSPKSYSSLPDGAHSFAVRATDPAGNTDPTPASRSFVVDTTPPDTSVDGKATAKKGQKQKGKKIVVKVKVKAKEDLTAKANGKVKVKKKTYKLKPQTKNVSSGSSKNLKLKPKNSRDAKRIAKALKKGKKAKAKLAVKLTDEAGNKKTTKLSAKLKRQ